MRNLAMGACGAFTAIITAVAAMIIHRLTGFSPVALNVNLFIPFGAILCGLVASSGYYFGAAHFRAKPSRLTLAQVVLVSGATMLLFYYMEYLTFRMPDGQGINSSMGFWAYLHLATRSAHLRLNMSHDDLGPLGLGGYGFLGLQVVGFALGGLGVCLLIFQRPFCSDCDLMLSKSRWDVKHFNDKAAFNWCYQNLYTSNFENIVSRRAPASVIRQGSLSYRLTLYSCPKCEKQTLREQVCAHNGKTFQEVTNLGRTRRLPDGFDCVPLFP